MTTPSSTTPLRSQPARDRIAVAARAVFAREGYERATVRLVAAEAGVHPSMITRYYGSKDQLFAIAATIDLRIPDLSTIDRAGVGLLLASHFMNRWEGAGSDGQLQALLRASVSHEAARDRLIEIFDGQVQRMLTTIVDLDRPAARAALIASQLLGLAFGRYVARLPALAAMDRDTIVQTVSRTIQGYLDEPLAA